MIEPMSLAILIASGLIVVSILTSLISFRLGAPLLLIFLLVGLAAGEDGIGRIEFDDAGAAYFIGSIALAIILFDSGFDTRIHSFRVAAGPALSLAVFGVVLTAGFIGVAAHLLFGLDWLPAMLLGAIVSSTDAAAVFLLLRVGGITIRDRVRSTLEIESGSNDPVAIFLTIALIEVIAGNHSAEASAWMLVEEVARQAGIGALVGLVGGLAVAQTVNRFDLEPALYPLCALALALVTFAAANLLGGSGFLAAYIAGFVAGNMRLRWASTLRRFQSGMTWLAQMGMFLTLGLLATPSEFPSVLVPAVVLALILTFLARPLAVWLCLLPFGFSRNETTFVAWVGLRGAVSILLGILPILADLPNGRAMFNVAFVIVLVSLLLQGWTIRPMARWLGLIVPPRTGPLDRVELELPGGGGHELVVYRVAEDSPVARGERIPRWARPSLIVRAGRSMRLHEAGRPQPGDRVYIFVPPRHVRLLDRLFAAPADPDVGDGAFFGDFVIQPGARLAEIGRAYGVAVDEADAEMTVGAYLDRAFGGKAEMGDRLTLGTVELIVRAVNERDEVVAVGLAVQPSEAAQPRLPVLQSGREIAALLRRLRARRRSPTDAAPPDTTAR